MHGLVQNSDSCVNWLGVNAKRMGFPLSFLVREIGF